ncbi:MAG: fumarate hydratase [Limnochordia bacterium]|nr:fumarate hydratase [Limnochordia bacterium]MDI9465278.1 fumarate hydratase [Bacillota bacterium]NLO94750.1 fumarate hydratase [Bacillota bacterium]HAI52202.1 fumarate hydratase [Bacillota bacterium]HAN94395.1 fumarate hydratase [Bacillota bacterium]
MRTIRYEDIVAQVKELCLDANCNLPMDVYQALVAAEQKEESPLGQNILDVILQNAKIAREKKMPLCQDTGMVVVFAEVGQDVHIEGGLLSDAVNEGVRRAYDEGYFRKSVVADPIQRVNTKDNTPAVLHVSLVAGDKLRLIVAPKGFGSENMSALKMLKPADGVQGIKDFVVKTVSEAGGNPCPPIIIGVGIGGTMEKAALLAKQAVLREIGSKHPQPHIAKLEEELLELVNKTGVGPQGFGGTQTALALFVETYPTHIAGLPVAVNINCHVARHAEAVL